MSNKDLVNVKNSFTRKEVIEVLNWVYNSKYHNRGRNGWNERGKPGCSGRSSEHVLEDAEMALSKGNI